MGELLFTLTNPSCKKRYGRSFWLILILNFMGHNRRKLLKRLHYLIFFYNENFVRPLIIETSMTHSIFSSIRDSHHVCHLFLLRFVIMILFHLTSTLFSLFNLLYLITFCLPTGRVFRWESAYRGEAITTEGTTLPWMGGLKLWRAWNYQGTWYFFPN